MSSAKGVVGRWMRGLNSKNPEGAMNLHHRIMGLVPAVPRRICIPMGLGQLIVNSIGFIDRQAGL